jgi:hypothetical protein
MGIKNTLRMMGLAGVFAMAVSAHPAAAALPSGVLQTGGSAASLASAAELTQFELEEYGYIKDQLDRLSPMQHAMMWAYLMRGEVAMIDGQLAVLWTRIDPATNNHYLMVKNYGQKEIAERLTLEYADGKDMTFPVVEVQPGEILSRLVTVLNLSGSRLFDLYDGEGNHLAELGWRDMEALGI